MLTRMKFLIRTLVNADYLLWVMRSQSCKLGLRLSISRPIPSVRLRSINVTTGKVMLNE